MTDEDIIKNYTQLAASTGESIESIAARVESVGALTLAAALRATATPDATKAPVNRRSKTTDETV